MLNWEITCEEFYADYDDIERLEAEAMVDEVIRAYGFECAETIKVATLLDNMDYQECIYEAKRVLKWG